MVSTDALKAAAADLGLSLGVCRAQMPPHWKAYRSWIEKGANGEMGYLEKHLKLKRHPENLLDGCMSIIAVALNYNQPNPLVPGQPRIARYALGRDYHKVLRGKLKRLQAMLSNQHPRANFRICVDSAPLMERDFAHLAGLGWFGKNTCLIDSKRGSWFVVGFLLTTLELKPDEPALGGCGTCTKCVEACPTGAIVFEEERWQVIGSRCISYLTIEKKGALPAGLPLAGWTFGCDVCQEVCPFNEPRDHQPLRAALTDEPDFFRHKTWPSLAELSTISADVWDVLTQGSPTRRAGREGLIRNALSNLDR